MLFSAPKTGSVNIIEQFGRFHSVRRPGLSILWPCIGQYKAGTVSLRLQSLTVRCETKTKDNVFLHIECCVQYKVTDAQSAEKFFYQLTDPEQQMTAILFDVIRSLAPKMVLDDIFISKTELGDAVQAELAKSFSSFGVAIVQTPITDIDPNQSVKNAMNQIQTNERLKIAARDEGEAAKIKQIKMAEAAGEATRIQAAAEAEATHLRGVGMAKQRHAILEGMRADVEEWSSVPGMDAQSVVALMLQNTYYGVLKDMGEAPGGNTIFVPSTPNSVNHMTDQIRDAMLMSDAAAIRGAGPAS